MVAENTVSFVENPETIQGFQPKERHFSVAGKPGEGLEMALCASSSDRNSAEFHLLGSFDYISLQSSSSYHEP